MGALWELRDLAAAAKGNRANCGVLDAFGCDVLRALDLHGGNPHPTAPPPRAEVVTPFPGGPAPYVGPHVLSRRQRGPKPHQRVRIELAGQPTGLQRCGRLDAWACAHLEACTVFPLCRKRFPRLTAPRLP